MEWAWSCTPVVFGMVEGDRTEQCHVDCGIMCRRHQNCVTKTRDVTTKHRAKDAEPRSQRNRRVCSLFFTPAGLWSSQEGPFFALHTSRPVEPLTKTLMLLRGPWLSQHHQQACGVVKKSLYASGGANAVTCKRARWSVSQHWVAYALCIAEGRAVGVRPWDRVDPSHRGSGLLPTKFFWNYALKILPSDAISAK